MPEKRQQSPGGSEFAERLQAWDDGEEWEKVDTSLFKWPSFEMPCQSLGGCRLPGVFKQSCFRIKIELFMSTHRSLNFQPQWADNSGTCRLLLKSIAARACKL